MSVDIIPESVFTYTGENGETVTRIRTYFITAPAGEAFTASSCYAKVKDGILQKVHGNSMFDLFVDVAMAAQSLVTINVSPGSKDLRQKLLAQIPAKDWLKTPTTSSLRVEFEHPLTLDEAAQADEYIETAIYRRFQDLRAGRVEL